MGLRFVLAAGALAAAAFQMSGFQISAQRPATPGGALKLHVHMYDLADVPQRTLQCGLGVTTGILARAGIETVWEPGSPDSPEAHTADYPAPLAIGARPDPDERDFLVIRLIGGFPRNSRPNALAFSLPAARSGVHVTVFYDRIETLSWRVPATVEDILGTTLAHEIGHVLLGSNEHAASGIMKAAWTRGDYQSLPVRRLEFPPSEALAMRAEVLRRAPFPGMALR